MKEDLMRISNGNSSDLLEFRSNLVDMINSAIQKVSPDGPEGFRVVDIINISRNIDVPTSYNTTGYRILYSSKNVHNYYGKYEWIALPSSPLGGGISEFIDAFLVSRKRNNKINEILT